MGLNKLDENGVVSRNKARLVAQGYNHQEGIEFDETYAPVARLESIRILLAYACARDFKLFQLDVKSDFLNGFINEEVYVAQLPRFVDFEKPNYVFKLKKALYDLKQAPKAWYDQLKAFLLDHSYTMGLVDNTLFTKKKDSHIIIVQIYVDDIIFISTCQDLCDDFSKIMHDEFEISMMGELNFFLGLQIKQFEDGIFFNQSKYVKKMLKKFGLENAKPIKTPMSSKTKLTRDEEDEPIDDTKYRGTIGSLLYLTASCPDIMFSILTKLTSKTFKSNSNSAQFLAIFFTPTSCVFPFFIMPKENKTNLKRTARISVRPCCFVNPRTSSPPYQPFSPPSDYTSGAPPTSPIISPPLSPIKINSNENCLLTPKSTPPPLTTPPPAPTQPSKLTSPVAINLDPIELLFSTPPSSPSLLDVLGDLPPSTTNPSPPRPSFATIERLANEPPPIPPINSTFPSPTPEIEPTPPPLPPHCLPPPPSQLPPLLPLGPNNPFPLLTHEMYCEHCQRTQVLVDNLQGEMRFILNHILDRLNVITHNI
ncbi:retrovirus-related pol polyprotein from transposon TNT 1-94 [Tanacetum coccineum]